MNKIIVFIVIITFVGGFIFGRMSTNEVVHSLEVETAITNIAYYTNTIYKEHFIITNNNVSFNELKERYNTLLFDSRTFANDYEIIIKNYRRLEKISMRKLFFIVGAKTDYNIDNRLVDLGFLAGIEYNRFGILIGYMIFDREISLSLQYRF